jgi:hypothetical protein
MTDAPPHTFTVGMPVDIIRGTYQGKQGIVEKICPVKITVTLCTTQRGGGQRGLLGSKHLMPTSLCPRRQQRGSNLGRQPDDDDATSSFGSSRSAQSQETAYFTASSRVFQVSPSPSSVASSSSARQSEYTSTRNQRENLQERVHVTASYRQQRAPETEQRSATIQQDDSSTPRFSTPSDFSTGMDVEVVGGTHNGKTGVVSGVSSRRVLVQIYSPDGQYEAERHLTPTNLAVRRQRRRRNRRNPARPFQPTERSPLSEETRREASPRQHIVQTDSSSSSVASTRHRSMQSLGHPTTVRSNGISSRPADVRNARSSTRIEEDGDNTRHTREEFFDAVAGDDSPAMDSWEDFSAANQLFLIDDTSSDNEDELFNQVLAEDLSSDDEDGFFDPSTEEEVQERPRSVATTSRHSRATATSHEPRTTRRTTNLPTGRQVQRNTRQTHPPRPVATRRPTPRHASSPRTSSTPVGNGDEPANPWAVPGAVSPDLHTELGLAIGVIQLEAPGSKTHRRATMAYRIFGDRLLHYEVSVSSKVDGFPKHFPHLSHTTNGRTYELLSTDLKKEEGAMINGFRIPKMKMWIQYVLVSGPGMDTINVQEELERLCDFGSENPRKAAARIKMLNSTASKSNLKGRDFMMFDLDISDFEEIDEEICYGYEKYQGTGYVPREYLEAWLGHHAIGKRTCAIQIRVWSPALGNFKGVLMEKPGIDKIQLPPSTKKLGPSRTNSTCRHVCLIVAGAGKHPTKTNVYVGNMLSGRKDPPKSFIPKNLSPMLKTLWEKVEVQRDVITRYAESSQQPRGVRLEHTCVVGVPDPTDGIPYGYVFIPGLGEAQDDLDEIFVTRFPCTAASDARMLPLLRERPQQMSSIDWNFLNNLHFGSIIFGNPDNPDRPPLAPTISSGDCDGDFYLICWNRGILAQCCVPPRIRVPRGTDDDVPSAGSRGASYNSIWFEECRLNFFNLRLMVEINQLIKALHGAWNKESNEDPPNIEHAEAFGEAFKKSLDMEKQGTKPYLPRVLWEAIDASLHHLLSDNLEASEELHLVQGFDDAQSSREQESDQTSMVSSLNRGGLIPVSLYEHETMSLEARSSNIGIIGTRGLISNHAVVSDSENEGGDAMSIDSESFYDASEGIRAIFDIFEVLD